MNERPVYERLDFPEAPGDRPYVCLNMVSTVDGKTVSGERDESVMDLGSSVDHVTMRAIENLCDGVMVGAGSLRATRGLWYPAHLHRYVVSGSGQVAPSERFFADAPDKAWVVTTLDGANRLPVELQALVSGPPIDWADVLARIKGHGVDRLLVEGGSELNASLLAVDVVDELFLTLAPKVKLGREVPTYAGGDPLPRGSLLSLNLVSCQPRGDEVFLRYRRARGAGAQEDQRGLS